MHAVIMNDAADIGTRAENFRVDRILAGNITATGQFVAFEIDGQQIA